MQVASQKAQRAQQVLQLQVRTSVKKSTNKHNILTRKQNHQDEVERRRRRKERLRQRV